MSEADLIRLLNRKIAERDLRLAAIEGLCREHYDGAPDRSELARLANEIGVIADFSRPVETLTKPPPRVVDKFDDVAELRDEQYEASERRRERDFS